MKNKKTEIRNMKHQVFKLISMIGIAGILCITGVGVPGLGCLGYIDNNPKVVLADNSHAHYGAADNAYGLFNKNVAGDSDSFYKGAMEGQFSKPYVDKALSDGLITQDQYNTIIDKLKDYGYLTESGAQNVTPVGGTSSPSSAADTSTTQSSAADNTKLSTPKVAASASTSASKSTTKAEKKIKSVEQAEATCITAGTKTTYYTDGTKKTESIPVIKHDYKLKDSKDATCTTAGYKTYTCSKCGDTYTDKIAALGHDFKLTETKAATCAAAGYKTYTCNRCGAVKREIIPKTEHTPGGWTVTKQAGLFTAGEKQQTCKVCGAILKTESIPQTCPLPLAGVVGIVIGVVTIAITATIIIRKKIKKVVIAEKTSN